MARIESSSLPNGLPLHRVELPTRSTTVLVAFDAGARTERPEENGMAHFLEHLAEDRDLAEAFGRFPSISANGGYDPAPAFAPQTLVEERDSNQSHLRMSYRPAIEAREPKARAALTVYSTLLGGSMGSRLF